MSDLAKIILLEGPRGAGKSVTGRLLAEKLTSLGHKATYFKKTIRLPDDEFNNMMDHIKGWNVMGGIVIVDRFAITEWVMSITHDRRHDYARLTHECLTAYSIAMSSGFSIILTADNDVLEKRMAERGEDGRTWDMDKEVAGPIWRAASGVFSCPILDTTHMTLENTVDYLYTHWLVMEQRRKALELVGLKS